MPLDSWPPVVARLGVAGRADVSRQRLEIRNFLYRRFGRVEVIGVQSATNVANLADGLATRSWRPRDPAAKWAGALLEQGSMAAFERVIGLSGVTTLQQWGETTLGMVTGNNRYFALSDQQVSAAGRIPSS